jgi:hypothetical protein
MMKGGLLLLLALGSHVPNLDSIYASARSYDKATFRYEPPTDRAEGVQALVHALVVASRAGKALDKQRPLARKLGFELVAAKDAGGDVWVLREGGERRRGDGMYVFRPGGAALCVQAPHTFFDERTGEIALALFAQTRATALFVNTVHRYAPSAAGEGAADVAHAERSVFQEATLGLLAASPLPIVQVHGFGEREHFPPDVSAVVSDGLKTRPAGAPVIRFRAALAKQMRGHVLLFGVDASELGATTNVQGRAVHRAGATFLHVELSREIRSSAAAPAAVIASALRQALDLSH